MQMAQILTVTITNRLDDPNVDCRLDGAQVLVGEYLSLPKVTGTITTWGREYDQPDLRDLGFSVCGQVGVLRTSLAMEGPAAVLA